MQTHIQTYQNEVKVWEYLKDKTELVKFILRKNLDLKYPRDKKQICNECNKLANYDFDEEVINRTLRKLIPKGERIGSDREQVYREYFRKSNL